jgi:hypothetical protein
MFWEETIYNFNDFLFVGIGIPQTTQNGEDTDGTRSIKYT